MLSTMRRFTLTSALALIGFQGAVSPARAADWPTLLGTEIGREDNALRVFGFAQLLADTPVAAPSELSLRRARLGARGALPGTAQGVDYLVALEAGANGVTRDRGVVVLDASVSVRLLSSVHLRVGQFKLPSMDETLESNPVTADFIHFSPLVSQLITEDQVVDGRRSGPSSGNRDVGAQLFGSTLLETMELGYAVMVSQGHVGGLDPDMHKDTTLRAQLAWLPHPEQRWSALRDELAVFAWRQQGLRVLDSGEALRIRQGVGAHIRWAHTRTRLEVVDALGALVLDEDKPSGGTRAVVDLAGRAWGWAFDLVVGGPGSALGPLELTFGLDELHRSRSDEPYERLLRNAVLGGQWHLSSQAKLLANWELRHAAILSSSVAAPTARAAAPPDTFSLQLTVLL